ncbi:HAAS signaling domain-containing protein [Frondihabitans cladoniiphilus]|uniref:DUF1700 domain-containing protein n=1 Tax=Frondihabitans cladoniiphilus TaxID=715785 RepID=A0ABP8W7Z3_9MICO
MTDTTPKNVTAYLAELENELDGVAPEVRNDIVAGVREELLGLDAAAAHARISELGDPAFIAAEARTEAGTGMDEASVERESAPGRASSIAAVVVLVAGSIVVPFVGAIVGLVWVSSARAWTRREKATAWFAPIVIAVLVFALSLLLASLQTTGSHVAVLVGYLVFPIEGVVLAVRARHRGWRVCA